MTRNVLEVSDVAYSYGSTQVLNEVDLKVEEGEIACLLGASGCGKTTLLRCIAGFESVANGMIVINGTMVSSKTRLVPPESRNVGIVFQDYALFPHLTVSENIAFGIRQKDPESISKKVSSLLASVNLESKKDAYPQELSGGQQQRVALIRALAPEPDLLLLDEPFSNLDNSLREKMKRELKALLKSFGVTAVLVTHNQDEAFDIADKIAVMQQGRILQWGSAYQLYHEPLHHFVAEFLGSGVFLPADLTTEGRLETELGVITDDPSLAQYSDTHLSILLRPDDIVADDKSTHKARVVAIAFRGMYQVYSLRLESGKEIQCFTSSHEQRHEVNSMMGIRLAVHHAVIFSGENAIVRHVNPT
ncbi:MAG: ABC transporter ATP-binding protein [Pseudobacteriovorax sp.]|nr:ABC transporter ATP-binding protein [Pseudobacteriovorax sp.]